MALAAWESLESAGAAKGSEFNPEGIEIALRRNQEIESGSVQTIGHSEFVRRTNDSK